MHARPAGLAIGLPPPGWIPVYPFCVARTSKPFAAGHSDTIEIVSDIS